MLRTYSGIPVVASITSKTLYKGAYVDPSIDGLFQRVKDEVTPSVDFTLDVSSSVVKIWVETGGLFNNLVLRPTVELSASERSFIIECAEMLTGRRDMRRLSWADWSILLCPSESKERSPALWSEDELDMLTSLKQMSTPSLIQRWVSVLGLGDMTQTIYLFVSPSI